MSINSTDDQYQFNMDDPLCAQYETYTLGRFIYIIKATLIATLGTIANAVLVYVFCTKRAKSTPATLYPTVLAILDLSICFEYILLFGVDAIVSYVKIESLFTLYYLYIIPAYVLSRITQLAIPYMLIFATLERLVWTYGKIKNKYLKVLYSTSGRHWTVIVTMTICCLLRLPTAIAMEVGSYPLCDDFFRTLTTQPRSWVSQSTFYQFFDFDIMTVAQTCIPFFLLIVLNMIIVKKFCEKNETKRDDLSVCSNSPPPSQSAQKHLLLDDSPRKISALVTLQPLRTMSDSVRSAIYTMAAIVFSYLISNTLHLVLTILERTHHPLLIDEEDALKSSTFHTFFSDMVSFVYMFTSAIRILIYYGCNPVIRKDIQQFFHKKHKTMAVDV
ncbi:unnamed protein product [Auanema sp. JU1783]|nr:unnamed protein product [Auanema sp. JU1783]